MWLPNISESHCPAMGDFKSGLGNGCHSDCVFSCIIQPCALHVESPGSVCPWYCTDKVKRTPSVPKRDDGKATRSSSVSSKKTEQEFGIRLGDFANVFLGQIHWRSLLSERRLQSSSSWEPGFCAGRWRMGGVHIPWKTPEINCAPVIGKSLLDAKLKCFLSLRISIFDNFSLV